MRFTWPRLMTGLAALVSAITFSGCIESSVRDSGSVTYQGYQSFACNSHKDLNGDGIIGMNEFIGRKDVFKLGEKIEVVLPEYDGRFQVDAIIAGVYKPNLEVFIPTNNIIRGPNGTVHILCPLNPDMLVQTGSYTTLWRGLYNQGNKVEVGPILGGDGFKINR